MDKPVPSMERSAQACVGRVKDKVTLISGVAGGQGRAAATVFAHQGAIVVGCDIDAAGCRETEALVTATGFEMTTMAPCDLTDRNAAIGWVEEAVDRHGRVDVLYNNAGAARYAPFMDISETDYRFTVDHDLSLVWFSCQAVWPVMMRQRSGSIVNVGSVAAMLGNRDLPQAAHSVTKAGVIALSRQLAAEGSAHGIRVNTVSPGVIATEAAQQFLGAPESPLSSMIDRSYTRLPGRPQDPVYAALFLASEEARFITGQNLVVDGGTTVFV